MNTTPVTWQPGESVTLSIPGGTTAFATYLVSGGNSSNLFAMSGSFGVFTNQLPKEPIDGFDLFFMGVVSDAPFTTVTVSNNPGSGAVFLLDNLTYVVPEPSGSLMAVAAATVLAMLRRGARRAPALA